MNEKYRIEMSSHAYGVEEFPYPTKREAVAGFNRLIKTCRKAEAQDSIPRSLELFQREEVLMRHHVFTPVA
jgi:hypothetical protein